MGIYSMIKKEFKFLSSYNFKISFNKRSGSYYFAVWTNENICIMVLYDLTDQKPVTIRTYDADSLGTVYDATVYKEELVCNFKKPKEKIRYAAEWLKNAIENKIISI